MKLESGKYHLELSDEQAYSFESIDQVFHYQRQYLSDPQYQSHSKIGIKIFEKDNLISSAIIGASGGGTRLHEQSSIVEKDQIVICCSDTLFCLSIPDLNLNWQTKADPATCFQLFRLQEDYVVHGELMISRIDKNGNVVWQQSGADIFTDLHEKPNFTITDSYIQVRDWELRLYRFDFDGNSIEVI